jgi:mannose-6-phosphate isomerase-like protein (cupin superfamily)
MKAKWLVLAAALALSTMALATNAAMARPMANSATFVGTDEIEAAVEKNNAGAFSDSPLRVVPIESKYNVGIAVVRRAKVHGRMLPDALIHEDVAEVYHILEGEGVLVTGGALQSAKPLTSASIVNEIGPSSAGQSIVGGTPHRVAPGDIVIIPPHTPHGFVDITTPRIVYTLVRIDPQKVLELRSTPR